MTASPLTDHDICLKCVDENEVIYDEKEIHLQRLSTAPLDCKEELFKEMLINLQICQKICLYYVKQLVIIKEPRVWFKAANDVAGLQMKIEETSLSLNLKTYLKDISKAAYKLMKEAFLLDNLVELDGERHASADIFGKKQVNLVGFMDMITLMDFHMASRKEDEIQTSTRKQINKQKNISGNADNYKQRTESKMETFKDKEVDNNETDKQAKTQTIKTDQVQQQQKKLNKLKRQTKVQESKDSSKDGESKSKEKKEAFKETSRAIVTFVLTARISVSAVQIFKQLLFLHMLPESQLYLFVCHIGPLNEDQELVLYQYIPDESLVKACQTTDTSGCLNLENLELVFRTIYGRKLQKLADLKEYFKYYIYDCPGVKDHNKDNRNRLERYLKKKQVKKEKQRQQDKKIEDSDYGSDVAEPCTASEQPNKDQAQGELSQIELSKLETIDSDIMSASDLQNHILDLQKQGSR